MTKRISVLKNRLRLGVAKVSMMLSASLLVASGVGAAPENTIVDIKIKPPVILAPQPKNDLSSDQNFSMIADSYFDDMFKLDPNWATSAGFHEHDGELENFSADFYAAKSAGLKSYLDVLNAMDAKGLSRTVRHDRELLINHIQSDLQDNDELKLWKKNPDTYSSTVSSNVFTLIARDFAPLQVRMKSVIARERLIPQALEFAKQNLDPQMVPKIYAEIALENMPGAIEFFKVSVPATFKGVKNQELQKEFAETTDKTVEALTKYQEFVKAMVDKGECKGTFVIGEDAYRKKLLLQDMVDEPIDSLLARGDKELKRLQAEFVALAKEIDPAKSPDKVYAGISSEHPKPAQLLTDIRNLLDRIRDFCVRQKIVTIASPERPTVIDTPGFMRALMFAALDTPGAYEKKATQSFYYVTPPEKDWTPAHVEEHMRAFSNSDLLCTSIHEAYPGHFVMYLHVKKSAPSKVRRLISSSLTDEGWAHYCEQMLLDEGFNKGDKKLKLTQLHDALLRCCRYMVGLKMHTRGMSTEDAIKFFMQEGYMEKANAERETKRGTSDPTYLVYTLGKMQILALREDYKKYRGSQYSLQEFHDKFLSAGDPPIKIIREEMILTPEK